MWAKVFRHRKLWEKNGIKPLEKGFEEEFESQEAMKEELKPYLKSNDNWKPAVIKEIKEEFDKFEEVKDFFKIKYQEFKEDWVERERYSYFL